MNGAAVPKAGRDNLRPLADSILAALAVPKAAASLGSNPSCGRVPNWGDPVVGVCRAARRLLLRGSPVDPDRLTFAALSSPNPHERRAAIELASAHDYWVAGILLLRIAGTRDPVTARRASAALSVWEGRFIRVFTKPSARQADEYEALLESANLDQELLGRLRALVPVLKARSH